LRYGTRCEHPAKSETEVEIIPRFRAGTGDAALAGIETCVELERGVERRN
jgi:hypothetical protein